MKIVIDIPKKTYNEIKEYTIITCGETFVKKLVGYIRNGTPLPEHHGRLIDKDKMIADLLTVNPQFHYLVDWSLMVTEAQPTIIEADKEREDKK